MTHLFWIIPAVIAFVVVCFCAAASDLHDYQEHWE